MPKQSIEHDELFSSCYSKSEHFSQDKLSFSVSKKVQSSVYVEGCPILQVNKAFINGMENFHQAYKHQQVSMMSQSIQLFLKQCPQFLKKKSVCVCVSTHACMPTEARRGFCILCDGVTGSCYLPDTGWEPVCLLQEQQVFLSSEPCLLL